MIAVMLPMCASTPGNSAKSLVAGCTGRGSEATGAPVWGISPGEYLACCDPWPLNPEGELLLGVKLESPEGIANSEEIIAVPGLGFAELVRVISAWLSAISRSRAILI